MESVVDLLVRVYCWIDDELKSMCSNRLRKRGPHPTLTDSEVITMELVGEFLGLDQDQAIFDHFRRYHQAEFPPLAEVNRTTFARQAANLWRVKQLMQQRLARRLVGSDPRWLVDSLPIEACRFARATFCQRFGGQADYGYDHGGKRTFYGFRLHLRTSRDGVILAYQLAPARANDKAVLPELNGPSGSCGIGDRGYWDPDLLRRLAEAGVEFEAPFLHKSRDPNPERSARLSTIRYRLETVNGQLAERYRIKRTWARDLWHLCHRLTRKLLSHTVMISLTVQAWIAPLSFKRLLAA